MTPALNQCKLSVVHHDQPTIDYCRTAGITYQSYSPLCGGFNGSSCSRSGGENVMTRPDVLAIADSHGVSAAQIGLKWIVQKGFPLTTAVWDLKYMRVRALDLAPRSVRSVRSGRSGRTVPCLRVRGGRSKTWTSGAGAT